MYVTEEKLQNQTGQVANRIPGSAPDNFEPFRPHISLLFYVSPEQTHYRMATLQ